MSQDFNDPEIFADFIVESREHLETIEPNLLELEKAPDNLSLLNDIFRPMHSLKGASGFMGLNRINTLAHRAENVLDDLRKGTLHMTSEIMDVILAATDALRQMIDNLESSGVEGDVETASLIAILDSIREGGVAPAPMPEAAITPQAVTVGPDTAPAPRREMSSADWINSLPDTQKTQLTAFGADHLHDFIEEARDNVSSISDGLIMLEKHPEEQEQIVNDTFRCFHNLKGNSGIIGYQELNRVTHESETLLNLVRKGEMQVSGSLVDILLLVVDVLEQLLTRIDMETSSVVPFDTSSLVQKLQQATSGGPIELPDGLGGNGGSKSPAQAPTDEPAVQNSSADIENFKETVGQQMQILKIALEGLSKDGTDTALADACYRALSTIQTSASYMELGELQEYAGRTAGIVDQGRKTGLDFGLMVDLLSQEVQIIAEIYENGLNSLLTPPTVEKASVAPVETAVAQKELASPDKAQAAPETPSEKPVQAVPKQAEVSVEKSAPAQPVAAPVQAATAQAASPAKNTAPAKAPAKEENNKTSSTIRVDHEKLDHLMNLIGELIINRNSYTMLARRLENISPNDVAAVAQDLSETTYAMARISDELQDTIMKVRMVPVSSVFSRFPRLVRDLSRKSGKEVDLILEGEETELDKSVVEVIGDPLVHLIRNSVDHGIEDEATRLAAGKPAKGRVYLRAFHKGNSVAIEIEDDGKGIDPEKMREVAVRKGIATQEEVRAMDDREAVELIFAPGFSAAEKVTDISGRGVGMDVVRTNIKSLKGSINTISEIGKGTRFTLSLPLTLAIIDALMVNVDGDMYAIPLDAVAETTKIEAKRLTDVKGRKAVTLRGEVLGIVSLAELLGMPYQHLDEQEVLSVVVIHDNDRRLGLVVDRLLERQEIVIKPLGSYLGDLRGISGATIMGDGSVILIMDPHEIYMMATSKTI